MPYKFPILAGVITVLAVAQNIKMRIETQKLAQLFLDASEGYEETQKANEEQIMYLCHMLDQHEIPVNEFDLIALYYNQ